ncbi:MAG: hypothetical protein KBD39_03575 [Sterolibacterium sp.]|nr:hypothetical protein [Sterolibacterium sp.]MBP9799175.1 hypothetical protein [Sterolibacterium sp.]
MVARRLQQNMTTAAAVAPMAPVASIFPIRSIARRTLSCVLLPLLLSLPPMIRPAQAGSPPPQASEPHKYTWELDRSDTPCKSYSSVVAGRDYVAAKAVCDVSARIEVLGTILRDIEAFPSWMYDCSGSKILKIEDDENDTIVFWLHQHIPILRDRDMLLRSTVLSDHANGIRIIEARSTDDLKHDSGKDVLRMPSFYAQYKLEWIDREHTRVTYLIDPDLGPGLPITLTNANIRKIPLRSMEGMMKMAKSKKYLDASKTSKYARWVEEALRQGSLK